MSGSEEQETNEPSRVDTAKRQPGIWVSSSAITAVIALTVGGTGYYSVQDVFTAEQAHEQKEDLRREIDSNKERITRHFLTHPDAGLDKRLRELETKVSAMGPRLDALEREVYGD